MRWIFQLLARVSLALALGFAPGSTFGAQPDWQDALTGRLRQIKEAGFIRLGYRQDAIPFSYLGAEAKPVGYTLDLCSAIAKSLSVTGAAAVVDTHATTTHRNARSSASTTIALTAEVPMSLDELPCACRPCRHRSQTERCRSGRAHTT